MANEAFLQSHRRLFRLALLFLIAIPFVPEIVILATAALANLQGCQANQKDPCLIASLPVSGILTSALQAGAGFIVAGLRKSPEWINWLYGAVAGWVAACFFALTLGWARTSSRILLGFFVTTVLAILPYIAPMLTVELLAHEGCRPDDARLVDCKLYGGLIGSPENKLAHDAVELGWLTLRGAPIVFGLYAVYAILVIAWAVIKRVARASAR